MWKRKKKKNSLVTKVPRIVSKQTIQTPSGRTIYVTKVEIPNETRP